MTVLQEIPLYICMRKYIIHRASTCKQAVYLHEKKLHYFSYVPPKMIFGAENQIPNFQVERSQHIRLFSRHQIATGRIY
jgi:hypothetical protein